MSLIWDGLHQAIILINRGDPEIFQITWLSLRVSGFAILASIAFGVPIGTILALCKCRTKKFWLSIVHTGMALPPVVVGLVISIMLWRTGPLGILGLMYTPTAMTIAQFIISAPIVMGLTASGLQQLDSRLQDQLLGLGASRGQVIWLLWREAKLPIFAGVMVGFGRVIAEVGASMMVGGNLRSSTRVLTTAIVLENSKGNFALAIALSTILMALVFVITISLTWIQQRELR
ncbi:MAG: ABC transporter permease [Chloroflexi bacterium]|nr:ABC transporter permease [Chloroflexota bacterium]